MAKAEADGGKACTERFALVLTIVSFFAEFIVGSMTNSVALVADSYRMLSTAVALAIGLFASRIGRKPTTTDLTFGYRRAEVLGTLVNGVFLAALCFSISVEALERFTHVEKIIKHQLLLIVGSIGLGVNLLVVLLILKSRSYDENLSHSDRANGRSGSGSTSRNRSSYQPRDGSDLTAAEILLRVLRETLGSIGVVISAIIVWKVEGEWTKYVDPVVTLSTVVVIMSGTVPMLRDVSRLLFNAAPKDLKIQDLQQQISRIGGVLAVHDLHVWELRRNLALGTVHVLLESPESCERIVQQVKHLFHLHNIHNTTIQPEFADDTIRNSPSSQANKNYHTKCCDEEVVFDADDNCEKRASAKMYGSVN